MEMSPYAGGMTTPASGSSTGTTAVAKAKLPVKRRLVLVGFSLVLVLLPAIVMVLITWVGTGKVQQKLMLPA